MQKAGGCGFLIGEHTLDRIAGVDHESQMQRQVLISLKGAEVTDRPLIVKNANVVGREIGHKATPLIGYRELQPNLRNTAAQGIARNVGGKVAAGSGHRRKRGGKGSAARSGHGRG